MADRKEITRYIKDVMFLVKVASSGQTNNFDKVAELFVPPVVRGNEGFAKKETQGLRFEAIVSAQRLGCSAQVDSIIDFVGTAYRIYVATDLTSVEEEAKFDPQIQLMLKARRALDQIKAEQMAQKAESLSRGEDKIEPVGKRKKVRSPQIFLGNSYSLR